MQRINIFSSANVIPQTVTVTPEPKIAWYRDDELIDSSGRYKSTKDNAATYSLNVEKLEIVDQVRLALIKEKTILTNIV